MLCLEFGDGEVLGVGRRVKNSKVTLNGGARLQAVKEGH